jgi:xylan 1,4-beta-xylosidase
VSVEDLARAGWAQLTGVAGAPDREAGEADRADLPAPAGLTAVGGRGQITLDWRPVWEAIGYAVHRSDAPPTWSSSPPRRSRAFRVRGASRGGGPGG